LDGKQQRLYPNSEEGYKSAWKKMILLIQYKSATQRLFKQSCTDGLKKETNTAHFCRMAPKADDSNNTDSMVTRKAGA